MMNQKWVMSNNRIIWPRDIFGIYAIVSAKSGKMYIGQTKDKNGFMGRWKDHRYNLRRNRHNNIYLQRSYNKHGEDNFYFIILEICSSHDDLFLKEFSWINNNQTMHYQNGYNLDKYDRQNSQKIFKIPIHNKKTINYQFIAPDGKIIEGNNLSYFAHSNGLSQQSLGKVLKGKRYSSMGYKSVNKDFHRKDNMYELISPTGKRHEFVNIPEFAKRTNIAFSKVYEVIDRKIPHIKGWRLPEPNDDHKIIIDKYLKRQFLLEISTGNILKFKSLGQFIRNYLPNEVYNTVYAKISKVLKNKKQSYVKFRVPTEEDMKKYPVISLDY